MVILGIIILIIGFCFLFIATISHLKIRGRKNKCKGWKLGDYISVEGYQYKNLLNQNGKKFATLKGWSLDSIYLSFGDGYVTKVEWSVMDENVSENWRKNYDSAKELMGVNPEFNKNYSNVSVKSEDNKPGVFDGKPIDTMSEIECEVYLKKL